MKWTPEIVAYARSRLAEQQVTDGQLAEKLGVSKDAITHARRRYNLPPGNRHFKWSGTKLKILRRMRSEGKSRRYIANYFGCSVSNIDNVIERIVGYKQEQFSWTVSELLQLKRLLDSKMSIGMIAIKMGYKYDRVKNAISYYNKRGWPDESHRQLSGRKAS